MILNKNEYIFEADTKEKTFYILKNGSIRLFLPSSSDDKEYPLYKISEIGAIVGIAETFLDAPRFLSLKADDDNTDLQEINLEGKNLKDTILNNPALGLQLAINLAVRFKRTNNRLTQLSKILDDIKNNTNEICLNYYECVEEFNELNQKLKFPWLKSIFDEAKMNLIYNYGKSAKSGKDVLEELIEEREKKQIIQTEKEDLGSVSAKSFKSGDVLCEEGELGDEMYILNEGALSVYVNNNKVAEIDEKGAIIGEIAVLLGIKTKNFEKRTATVKVKKDAKIICVPSANIREFIKKDPKIIVHTCKTLSERLPDSYSKLVETYEKMDKAISLLNPNSATSSTCPKAFDKLMDLINEKANDKDKIKEIIEKTEKLTRESKDKFDKYQNVYEKLLA
jgi:CRP-like cAMP-binding protein